MKTKLLFVLMSLFLIASCSKEDKLIPTPDPTPTPDPAPTLPIAKGETHWMILSTTKAVGDTIKLHVNAAKADRENVWIDLNANGKKEEGEAVTEFSKELGYKLVAQNIVVYGNVNDLRCQESNLTALDVSSNDSLKLLYCYDNQLTSIDVSKNPKLNEFRCQGNQLSLLDVSQNKELKYLWCGFNALTELDISQNSKLIELWLSGNKITDADKMQKIVDALPKVEEKAMFWVVTNQTSKENAISKEQVKIATDKGWKVWDDKMINYTGESANPTATNKMALSTSKAAGETIALRIDAINSEKKDVWIDLNNNSKKDEGEAVTEFSKHVDYSLGAKSITVYGKVYELRCQKSNLTALDVSSNDALEILYCYENGLNSLDVSKNPKLEYLWCADNALTELDISKNSKLIELWISGNKITDAGKMQKIVNALPKRKKKDGKFWVVKTQTSKENTISREQVKTATDKGWSVEDDYKVGYTGELADPTATNKMTLSTNKAVGEKIKLKIDATKPERKDVWIDLNNNDKKDEGEAVTIFDKFVDYNLGAQSIVVYGNVNFLDCRENQLNLLDVSNNPTLERLVCDKNKLSALGLDKNKNKVLRNLGIVENEITSSDEMQSIIDALPKWPESKKATFWVVKTQTSKENTISKGQVKTTTGKGWQVKDGKNANYAGE